MKQADLLPGTSLQPHQKRVQESGTSATPNRLLLLHGLGSGKTLSSLATADTRGLPYTAIVPAALRPNLVKEQQKFLGPSAPPGDVISYSALAKGGPLDKPRSLIFDECLPAGTLVDGRPIEEYRVGDELLSVDHGSGRVERKAVSRTSSRPTDKVWEFEFFNGRILVCTEYHPLFTDRGYVPARDVTIEDRVAFLGCGRIECEHEQTTHRTDLCDLSSEVFYDPVSVGWPSQILLERMPVEGVAGGYEKNARRVYGQNQGEDEDEQSDARRGVSSESVRQVEGDKTLASCAGRERSRGYEAREGDSGRAGVVSLCYCPDRYESDGGTAITLQDRCWERRVEDSDRGRRKVTPEPETTSTRCEKDGVPRFVGLVRISIHEQGSGHEFERLCPGGKVFDIEVEGNHNFFAEGFLVHNSHRLRNPDSAQSQQASRVAADADQVILATGTPVVNHPSDFAPLYSILTGKPITPDEFTAKFVDEVGSKPSWLGRLFGKKPVLPGAKNVDELTRDLAGKIDAHAAPTSDTRVDRTRVEVPMSRDQARLYRGMYEKIPLLIRHKLKQDYPLTQAELKRLTGFLTGPRQVGLSTLPFMRGKADPVKAFDRSPKLQAALDSLQGTFRENPDAKALIFSNFIDAGLTPYQKALDRAGVPSAVFSGKLTDRERKQLVDDYNAGKIRAALLGPSGTEGLSFKGTRLVQRLDPHWHDVRQRQALGRADRFDSHTHLDPADRQVAVQDFISRVPRTFGAPTPAVDDWLADRAAKRDELNRSFVDTLRQIAAANGRAS